MSINERSDKFELLDRIVFNKSIYDILIPSLIKQKVVYLRETKVKTKVKRNFCIYCGFNFTKSVNFCINCGKNLQTHEAFIFKEFSDDVYEKFLNYDYLIKLIDKDLGNSEKLLIYEKKFDNLPPNFIFPKINNWLLILSIIRILQVTRVIQNIFQPDVITHYSINQLHNALYKAEDFSGKKLKLSWGFYKFKKTKFPEEYDDEASESRADLIFSYKDASVGFDYEAYFSMQSNDVDWSEIDFDKPEIVLLGYNNIIENKISAFATKIRNGACVFKIYLLESKRIKIIQ